MTAPTAFLVDANSTITPHVAIAVNPSTGVPTMQTVDGNGNPVSTIVGGGGGGGSGNVTNVGTFASTGALQTAFPAVSNLGNLANVGTSAPYSQYTSNGTAWVIVGGSTGNVSNVGTFANTAALQAAFPAASNLGNTAQVGNSAPYTAYVSNGSAWVVGAGTGAVSTVNGQTGVVTITPANINGISVATPWPAATNLSPTLVSGTALSGIYAGVNVVQNTSPGVTTLSPAIDTITTMNNGDFAVFGTGGVNTWTQIAGGGSYFGIFASSGALQAAYPAASNSGCTALVGASAPYAFYLSNGSAWIAPGTPSAPATTALMKGDGAGGLAAAVPGQNYAVPAVFQRAVPTLDLGSWTMGANGALTVGNQPAGSVGATLTFGANSGNGVTCGSSATTFTSTAVDVGKVITLDNGKTATIATFVDSQHVTVNITGTLSTTTFTAWALAWPVAWQFGSSTPYSTGCWLTLPANSLSSSNVAGRYWAVQTGQTLFTVYTNTYTPGGSYTPPASPTAYVGAAGAVTTNSTSATLPADSITVPANYLGISGEIVISTMEHNSPDAGTAKQIAVALNANPFNNPLSYNANGGNNAQVVIMNAGATNKQVGAFPRSGSSSAVAPSTKAVDTTAITTLTVGTINANSAGWISLDQVKVEMNPGN